MPRQQGANPRLSRGMVGGAAEPLAIGPFTVDLLTARVYRDGCELRLRPQVFQVLRFLIQNSGRLVDYEEMLQAAWGGTRRVSKHTVAVTVGELKDVLKEYASWITIRPGYGYSLEIPESEHLMRVGRHFRNQSTRSGFDNALRCFEQVTEIEGGNARAWEAVAGLHIEIGFLSARAPRDVHKSFVQAYHRAVTLQGLTPGLRYYRAVSLYRFEWKLAESKSELERVLQDGPELTRVHVHLAVVCYLMGRTEEAFEELRKVEKTDPLLPSLAFVKPRLLLYCREVDAAASCAKQAITLHPNSPLTHLAYADVLDFQGDTAALPEYHIASTIAPDVPWIRAAEARCLARQGRSGEALKILAQLQRNRHAEYLDANHLAFLLEALGKRDEALQELERAYAERSPMIVWLDRDTRSDTLKNDPRFAALSARVSSTVVSEALGLGQ
jgi:tetratricopeptide (TPR) repeat protein